MTTPTLAQILTDMSKYVEGTHYVVVDDIFETVAINNDETGETEIFLQDHQAAEFIEQAKQTWLDAEVITMTVAINATAKPYVESLA